MSFDPGAIEIRELLEPDLEAMIRIAEMLEEAPHWPAEVYAALLDAQSACPRIALIAQERGSSELLGFAIASLVAPEAELESIAVASTSQRRGVGSRLLSALAGRLRQAGIATLHLEVRASNLPAIALYASFGFSEMGRRPRYYADPVEDAVLMNLVVG